MNNMTARKATTAVAVVLVSLTSAMAVAHGMRGDGHRAWSDLNLSEAQKAQIEKIEQQYRPAPQPDQAARQAQFQQWHQQKQQLLQGRQFNENAARQLIQQRQQQHAEREMQHLRKQHAIFQVLNAEQQQKWLAKRGDGAGKKGQERKGGKHERKAPLPQGASATNK
ncbi:protein CpxP [Neisseria sp. HSC-16F19]|nr:Spy/CpxP family protein refolding chaperone [Neisseria sp. HSC-16F19]MCP2041597.1 protein CpxP [Neisseria sp. HSC-16F19]